MLHSFYLYYERDCILSLHFSDMCKTAMRKAASSDKLISERDFEVYSNNLYEKLMCGYLTGLDQFSSAIAESDAKEGISVANYNTCSTSNYKIHYLQPLTGYKLVCFTSPEVPSLKSTLEIIYSEVIVKKLHMNPDYQIGSRIDDLIILQLIEKALTMS